MYIHVCVKYEHSFSYDCLKTFFLVLSIYLVCYWMNAWLCEGKKNKAIYIGKKKILSIFVIYLLVVHVLVFIKLIKKGRGNRIIQLLILVSSLEETFKEVDPNLCSHIFHLRWPGVYDPLLSSCRGAGRKPLASEDAYFYDLGQNVQKKYFKHNDSLSLCYWNSWKYANLWWSCSIETL